jgi:hypothetical protein
MTQHREQKQERIGTLRMLYFIELLRQTKEEAYLLSGATRELYRRGECDLKINPNVGGRVRAGSVVRRHRWIVFRAVGVARRGKRYLTIRHTQIRAATLNESLVRSGIR